MPRMFTLVSIVVHTIVIASVLVAQLLAVGALPTPHQPLSFESAMPARIVNIPLPAPPRRDTRAVDTSPAVDPATVAPISAPAGVQPDRALTSGGDWSSPLGGVESGFSAGVGLTPLEHVPPPPAPTAPPTPIRLRSNMQAPRKIVNVDPAYPRLAQLAHVQGVVILEAIIDAQGRVTSARVLRSIPQLNQAAIDAVGQWTFTPALLNGVAVPVVMTVTVNFTLNER